MDSKPFWESKTFWINLVSAPLTYVAVKLGLNLTPDLEATVVAGIIGGINIVLRFLTKDKVTLS